MAIMYKSSSRAFKTVGESLTEQEHTRSCDINVMLKQAKRGQLVRGSRVGVWRDGTFDDTTMSAADFHIQKAELESSLSHLAGREIDLDLYNRLPPEVRSKLGLRIKSETKKVPLNDDDLTTTKKGTKVEQHKDPADDPSSEKKAAVRQP